MGTRWGINRTVAQIHALLFLSDKPLNADDIIDALDIARSNVSTSLRELQGWGIVKLVHVLDDKRDHFESMKDVWEVFRLVPDERKKPEIDPALNVLRECIAETKKDTQQRLREIARLFRDNYRLVWADSALALLHYYPSGTPSVLGANGRD